MNKFGLALVVAIFNVVTCIAAEETASSSKEIKSGKEIFYQNTGGFVRKPGTNSGKVTFVNAQSKFARPIVEAAVNDIGTTFKVDVEIIDSEVANLADAARVIKSAGGTVGVVVVELDSQLPALLVVPDERCSIVNTGAFPSSASNALLNRQIVRGFAAASGALESQIMPTIMSAFENLKKLEKFPVCEIPADVGVRVRAALRTAGITPYIATTYKHACREGWAPPPVDDVQRAIWEEVQAEKERGPAVQRPIRRQGQPPRPPRRAK